MSIPNIELKSLSEQRVLQNQKLSDLLLYAGSNSPHYKKLFHERNISPEKIKTLEDLKHLPFTEKEDLQLHNDDFFCVDKSKIIDYVTSSGTLGEPIIIGLTESDLKRLEYNEYLSLVCANGSSADIYQIITTLDRRFMAGLAYYMGVRRMGAGAIRVGSGIPELQWDTIRKIKPSALITVPSFMLPMIRFAKQHGIDVNTSGINKAICIGEPIRNPDFSLSVLAEKILNEWNVELYSTYASTEMQTAFTECNQFNGGHHHPELLVVEVLDEGGNQVRNGESGEVVITTLGVEGVPLLRYKTGDVCHYFSDPCKCGRHTIRLGPVIGRKKQMIKYKGTTLYPQAFFDILGRFDDISNYVVVASTNATGTDEIKILAASKKTDLEFEKELIDHIKAKLRVAPKLEFTSNDKIEALQNKNSLGRKVARFIDERVA
ncbi:MAG: AMP-binding protein [Bacteroidota bacterium]